ncbi:MAG: AI-2E family transporter [Bacillaceae bacterium]
MGSNERMSTMDWINKLVKNTSFKRMMAVIVLVLMLFLIRDMFNVMILTFIIGYIMANIQGAIIRSTSSIIKLPEKLVQIFVYILVLSSFGYLLYTYVPVIASQLEEIFTTVANFNFYEIDGHLISYVEPLLKELNVSAYIKEIATGVLGNVKIIWNISFQLIMAFLLSFLFLWEKKNIATFMKRFESSRVSFFYSFYVEIGQKFINSFGKMIQVQIMISSVNTILTTIFLVTMGFPKVVGLAFLVFILGLIPVAGVIISLVPLSVIAFQVGGISMIIALIVMIAVVHAIESYILNPKLTSQKMHLPVFLTFFILLFGEHYLGVWGLLIGLPLFVFILDLLEVKPKEEK